MFLSRLLITTGWHIGCRRVARGRGSPLPECQKEKGYSWIAVSGQEHKWALHNRTKTPHQAHRHRPSLPPRTFRKSLKPLLRCFPHTQHAHRGVSSNGSGCSPWNGRLRPWKICGMHGGDVVCMCVVHVACCYAGGAHTCPFRCPLLLVSRASPFPSRDRNARFARGICRLVE